MVCRVGCGNCLRGLSGADVTGIIGFRKNASLWLSAVDYVHLARGAFVNAAIWHDLWRWQVISGVPAARTRGASRSPAPHRLSLRVMLGLSVTGLMVANAKAQDAEPRAYTNTPVGINFLIGGYVYSQGKMAFDPSLSIADAQFHIHTAVLAYVRSVDVWGKSAKFDVILPYSSFSAHGLVSGQPRAREMSGSGDPRFRFSINLFGAPALSVKEFANYRQDLIIGASLQVSAPLGQYDNSKLLNLGNNRWSFRPELGISKAWGPWTVSRPQYYIFHRQY